MNELPNEITLCSYPTEEKFLDCTRRYIDRLFSETNKENKGNIIVDQIVPASNVNHYLRYFNDIKVFVVDRDPRDIYILEKYVWKGSVVPTESVEIFCQWFEYTRRHRKSENYNENVMFVQFEDLIYKYEETVSKIEKYLGFSAEDHVNKFKSLDPKRSINNTRMWEKLNIDRREVEYIEEKLKDYLYEV